MFSILIKYKSTTNKTFWYDYEIEQEDGTTAPFSTSDREVLCEEIKKLDQKFGFENLKIIDDISYSVGVEIDEADIDTVDIATEEDINNIYNTAFTNVFG